MTEVLLAVSRAVDPDLEEAVARGERPMPDYVALARGLPATILDLAAARAETGRAGRLIERTLGAGPLLAWAVARRRGAHRIVVTDGEHVGIPLAALLLLTRERPRHVMIAHVLDVPKKAMLIGVLRLHRAVDHFVVYARAQKAFIERTWPIAGDRISHLRFQVDDRFFDPALAADHDAGVAARAAGFAASRPLVCAVGAERRDYRTLAQAVAPLDIDVVLARGSVGTRARDDMPAVLPPNVREGRFSYLELRALYAAATLVVVPLHPVTFAAGITAILEAMAMARPVIVSGGAAHEELVEDDVTGVVVPPHDAEALRAAIDALVRDADRRARLAAAARERVLREATLERYVSRLREVVGGGRAGGVVGRTGAGDGSAR